MCGEFSSHLTFSPRFHPLFVIKICDISFLSLLKNFILGSLVFNFSLVSAFARSFDFASPRFCLFFYFIYNGNFLCFKQAAHCFLFVTGDWRLESARLAAISCRFGLGITVERCSSLKFIRLNFFFYIEVLPRKLLVSGNRVD